MVSRNEGQRLELDESRAQDLLAEATGRGDWRLERCTAGKFSDVFLASADTQRRVLRVAPPDDVLQLFYEYRMMRREPAIHERLLAETDVPVPGILHTDFSRRRIDRDWMVMQHLPGTPFSTAHVTLAPDGVARALRQWGRCIARVHTVRAEDGLFGYRGDEACMTPQPTWPEAFGVMYRRLLDDTVACGVYDSATADDAHRLLEDHLDALDHNVEPVLLHGDIWSTNLLVDRTGRVTGVLDFDRACWGDPEWDLAIAEYCGVTKPDFWAGYGQEPQRTRDGAIRRMFYLLYEHQKYITISVSSRRNDPGRAQLYAEQSLAVMERFRQTGEAEF